MNRKKLYFGIYDFLGKRSALEADHFLEGSQYWGREKIEQYQTKMLYEMITHAKRNIPFYKDRIKITPDKKWGFQEMMMFMQEIPILTKKDIQDNFDLLIDPNIDRNILIPQNTGGTTGRPTYFYHDRKKLDYTRVALQRNFDWAGYTMRKKCLRLACGSFETSTNMSYKGRVKNFLYNRSFIEAAFLKDNSWAFEALQLIQKKKIKILWGYPSIIYTLARELRHEKDLHLESIITSSESLQTKQRELIEKVFNCKVFDDYGSREFMIAAECNAHDGLHINEELLLLEILDKENRPCAPGDSGKMIITDFFNKSFPFIRYEIGDEGSFLSNDKCDCERTLKRLKCVNGRSSDSLIINNNTVSTVYFAVFFRKIKNVEAFQLRIYDDALSVNIILFDNSKKETIEEIKFKLHKLFGEKFDIEVNLVNILSQEPNGKVLSIKKINKSKYD